VAVPDLAQRSASPSSPDMGEPGRDRDHACSVDLRSPSMIARAEGDTLVK
jgi:hypothetical protein